MGFLDHLFKLKSSDEKMGDSGATPEAAPDPGAFLQPKYFVTRGRGSLPPAPSNGRAAERSPPPEQRAQEIVLTLGDVLSRIPTQLLSVGLHDTTRELRFSMDDLSSDIARGRAAVPLSKIAALCPDVFARDIGPHDDTEIRLPLQKLVEQIGLLRARPAPPSVSPATPPAAPAHDAPPPADPAPAPAADRSPVPPPPDEPLAAARVAPVFPSVQRFNPSPPRVIAAPAAPLENHAARPAPPVPPAAAAPTPPEPAIRLHPPPAVRPVLVQPPSLFATGEHPAEPPVSSPPASQPVAEPPSPFPLEALQAVFMTDQPLDLAAVCRHTTALPGIRACALAWRDEHALAGEVPPGFDLATLHAATPQPGAAELPIGHLENVTLHGDQAAISIFTRPGLLLAVLHRPLPPGVRERLTAIATALAPRPPEP